MLKFFSLSTNSITIKLIAICLLLYCLNINAQNYNDQIGSTLGYRTININNKLGLDYQDIKRSTALLGLK